MSESAELHNLGNGKYSLVVRSGGLTIRTDTNLAGLESMYLAGRMLQQTNTNMELSELQSVHEVFKALMAVLREGKEWL